MMATPEQLLASRQSLEKALKERISSTLNAAMTVSEVDGVCKCCQAQCHLLEELTSLFDEMWHLQTTANNAEQTPNPN